MEQDSSERLNQITLADMEFIPNTAYVYFEFSGTSNVGGNELKVIRNVHVPLKQQNGRLVQFLYNENREVVAEKDYSGNIIRYIRGLGLISSDSENAKTYYHYVCDEQGSVSRIIRGEDKENGAAAQDKVSDRVLNHYEYDAFGNTISCEERVANRFRYQSGKTSKNGYEYLDDQLGSLKDKVKINQYQSAESVNDLWEARGYKSPNKEKTVVQNITLTEDTKFVRVYDGVNSNLEGGWVMRAEDIKGLTPKEIQAEFALEYEPKFIGEVELKAGDTVRLGEVGPNFGFDGGGIQIDLQQQWIGDFTELGKIEDWR